MFYKLIPLGDEGINYFWHTLKTTYTISLWNEIQKKDRLKRQNDSYSLARFGYEILSSFASEEDRKKISPDHFAPYKFEIFDDYTAISWDTISIYYYLKDSNLLPDFVSTLAQRDKDFSKAIQDFTYANTSN